MLVLIGTINLWLGVFGRKIGSNGDIHLDFIKGSDLCDDMREFDDFQLYRRIHAVDFHINGRHLINSRLESDRPTPWI